MKGLSDSMSQLSALGNLPPGGAPDATGAAVVASGSGASGTLLTSIVGTVIPIAAGVQLNNAVAPTSNVVINVNVNGSTSFTLTILPLETASVPSDVATEYVGLLSGIVGGNTITLTVASGSLPGSTTMTARLYSAAPLKPLAIPGKLQRFRTHPTSGPIYSTAWPALGSVCVGSNNGSRTSAPQTPSSIVKDSITGNLYSFHGMINTDFLNGGPPPLVGPASGQAQIYGFRLPASSVSPAFHTALLQYSPLAYWKMGEPSGTTMTDSSGNANNGTYTSVTLGATGKTDGTAASFASASSSHASAAIDLSGQNCITVACLFSWTTYANDGKLLMEFTANSFATPGGFYIQPNRSSGNFRIELPQGNSSGEFWNEYARPSAGYHLLVVCLNPALQSSSPSQVIMLWIDGVLQTPVASSNLTSIASTFANSTLNIMSENGASNFGNGSIQHLAIFPNTAEAACLAQSLAWAAGYIAGPQWQPMGLIQGLQAGADPVTGLTDQTGYAADAQPVVFLDGTVGFCFQAVDIGQTGFTRCSFKMVQGANWESLADLTPMTLYSRLVSTDGSNANGRPQSPCIVPRPLTNDYLILCQTVGGTNQGGTNDHGMIALTLASFSSLCISDAAWNAAPQVVHNQEEGGNAIVRNGIVYKTGWHVPGRNDTETHQHVYQAPLASATDPAQWSADNNGQSFWGPNNVDTFQDGGVSADSIALGYDAPTDTAYVSVVQYSKTHAVNSVFWSQTPFGSIFSGTAGATVAASGQTPGTGAASIYDWPVASTSSFQWTGTPAFNGYIGILIGKDPAGITFQYLQLEFVVNSSGWQFNTYDASGNPTTIASGASPAIVAATPITVKLARVGNVYVVSVNGIVVTTQTASGAGLLASLNGASSRWKIEVSAGQQVALSDVTVVQ